MAESKGNSEGSEEEDKERPEDFKELFAKSLGDIKVTPELVESSKDLSAEKIEYLVTQLDDYLAWEALETSLENETVKGYSKGRKEFRLTLEIKSGNLKQTAEFFKDLGKRMRWDPKHWGLVLRCSGDSEVVQVLHSNFGSKSKYTEYVLARDVETKKSEDEGEYVIIKERSVQLPASAMLDVKRLNINACVYKLVQKVDTDGQQYVECQALWYVEEGYVCLSEYSRFVGHEIDFAVVALNRLLQTAAS